MSITVKINTTDRSANIVRDSLTVEKTLGQYDTASFRMIKNGALTTVPVIGDAIEILDGASTIFAGVITQIGEIQINPAAGLIFSVECAEDAWEFEHILVNEAYESKTITEILADLITTYAPGYTSTNAVCTTSIVRIIFNQIPLSEAIKRLADLVGYSWYVSVTKDLHFISKYSELAPYNLTDTDGYHISMSLSRAIDGTQIINQVLVRGGEYNGSTFTDVITVSGNDTKSFKLPYKFASLVVELDTGAGYVAQNVGIDGIDTFDTDDVLYNYNERTIYWENALADGDLIKFSGYPKRRVLAQASDEPSIALYGVRQKIIRDNSIEDLATARKRAQGELLIWKDPIGGATFKTYTGGILPGQKITITSTIRGIAIDYIVKRVRFSVFTPTAFAYEVELTTEKKLELADILKRTLKPEDATSTDTETLEDLKSDNQTITITETITNQAPETDDQTITITENIEQYDTLPDFVLGPYTPTGQSDTKRWGVFERSFTLY